MFCIVRGTLLRALALLLHIAYLNVLQVASLDSVRFLVLGDWGGLPGLPYHTSREISCAKEMGKIADTHGTQFQLALGDNFYFDGIKDVEDKRFLETFENVFTATSLNTRWYLVAGNHDHKGNVSAQIKYTQFSKRWYFPDYNYTMVYPIPDTNLTIQFVMIDTVILCGNTDDFVGEAPIGPENVVRANQQFAWIEQTLQNSKADYVIVGGHYPVYSIGEHGPTKCLVSDLEPLLHKYQVTAYLSGHDHSMQHLQYLSQDWLMNYFVIGAANFVDPSQAHRADVPEDSLKFHWAHVLPTTLGSVAYIEVTGANMTLAFIESGGNNLYMKVLYPRKPLR